MGVEDLFSGTFSPDRVSVLHARVYIAPGNKLWGNPILFEAAAWLSSRPGCPVAGHQATAPPTTLGVHYLSHSAKPSLPHLLPATVKYVQPVLGFTDTAVKAFWRQPCRRRQKVPWTRWVRNAPDRVSSERPASRTTGPDALQNLFPALDLRDTTSTALVPPGSPFAFTLQVNRTRVHLQAHTDSEFLQGPLWSVPEFRWAFTPAQVKRTIQRNKLLSI